jgi:PAS domain S-box-containing protein
MSAGCIVAAFAENGALEPLRACGVSTDDLAAVRARLAEHGRLERVIRDDGSALRTWAVPLFAGQEVLGIIVLVRPRESPPFHTEDELALEDLADRAAMALDSARTREQLRAARDQLQAAEQRHRAVCESAHDAIISADASGHITAWNPGAQAVFGYSAREAIGEPLTMILPERFHEAHRGGMKRYLATGVASVIGKTVEPTGTRRDGTEFPIELTMASWELAGETSFIAILRDVSERSRAARLRTVQSAVSHALAESTTMVDSMPTILRVLCENLDWELGILWLTQGAPSRLVFTSSWAHESMRDGPLLRVSRTTMFERGYGVLGWAWVQAEPIATRAVCDDPQFQRAGPAREDGVHAAAWVPIRSEGEVSGVLELFHREPRETDREELEVMRALGQQLGQFIQRQQVAEALANEHELLAEAQQLAHLGSWEWNVETGAVTWSDELYRIWGHDPADFGPSYQRYLDQIHPEDRKRVEGAIRGAYASLEPFSFEHRIVWPDGQVRYVQSRGRVIASPQGTPLRLMGTAQDITDRKSVEAKLVVGDRMVSVGTLAAGVAHEINNPLAYVMTNLDMIAEELEQQRAPALESLCQMVEEARNGAERVRRIVRDLRTFSRADEERRVALDVRGVLDRAINMSFNEIRHRARLEIDYGEVPMVDADEARLGQVFINLLVNAAQALPDGHSERHKIRVTAGYSPSGGAEITISDTGAGIPPQLLNRIFDPFFTTKAVGAGTGLGLSICHGIVTRLGGDIAVESEPGKGTMFTVRLPPAVSTPARIADPPQVAAAHVAPRARVLVVDDDALLLTSLKRLLREHDVTAVGSGREALAAALAADFDLVLCDLMMPDMTGMDLHAALTDKKPELTSRMVFMTGGAFTPSARAFLDAVPNDRLDKPFDTQELRALVQRFVQRDPSY